MYAFMYECIYVCMYACMLVYICMYACMYVCRAGNRRCHIAKCESLLGWANCESL